MFTHFSIANLPETPWKNGGGSTREIACWPPGASLEDFGWRVSIATIERPGPFSQFVGVDRLISLLNGDGVHLTGPGADHLLQHPLEPFEFRGETPIHCVPLGAPSSDFNVMSRRGSWRAEVQVLRTAVQLEPASHGVLLAARGGWSLPDQALPAGHGLWWADAIMSFNLSPHDADGRLLAVRFEENT